MPVITEVILGSVNCCQNLGTRSMESHATPSHTVCCLKRIGM